MDAKSQELLDFVCFRMREHRRVIERWEHRRRTAVVQLVCNMVHLLVIRQSCMQIRDMTESMNKVANVLQEGNEILKDSNLIVERAVDVVEKGRPRFYNEGEIYSAVEELGFHRNKQLDAYLFLINNNTAARSFFGTPSSLRAEVLMKMMNLL